MFRERWRQLRLWLHYGPPHDVVAMRHAEDLRKTTGEDKLAPEARQQVNDAARRIIEHYGEHRKYEIWVVGATTSVRCLETARYLLEALGDDKAGHLNQQQDDTAREFLKNVAWPPRGTVVVIVTNEISIDSMIINSSGLLGWVAGHAMPYAFVVRRSPFDELFSSVKKI